MTFTKNKRRRSWFFLSFCRREALVPAAVRLVPKVIAITGKKKVRVSRTWACVLPKKPCRAVVCGVGAMSERATKSFVKKRKNCGNIRADECNCLVTIGDVSSFALVTSDFFQAKSTSVLFWSTIVCAPARERR